MYHIKDTTISKRNTRSIVVSLTAIMYIKKYESVTIADIMNITKLNPQTFYRLFDSKDDVILYIFDDLFNKLSKSFKKQSPKNISEVMTIVLKAMMESRNLAYLLVQSRRTDLAVYSLNNLLTNLPKRIFGDSKMSNEQFSLTTYMFSFLMIESLTKWSLNGEKTTIEEMLLQIQQAINFAYRSIIID